MLWCQELILTTELENRKRPFEQLRIEIFVINQEIKQILVFELCQNGIFPPKRKINNLLQLIQSSQSPLKIPIDDQIHYQLQTFLLLLLSRQHPLCTEITHIVKNLYQLPMIRRHGKDIPFPAKMQKNCDLFFEGPRQSSPIARFEIQQFLTSLKNFSLSNDIFDNTLEILTMLSNFKIILLNLSSHIFISHKRIQNKNKFRINQNKSNFRMHSKQIKVNTIFFLKLYYSNKYLL